MFAARSVLAAFTLLVVSTATPVAAEPPATTLTTTNPVPAPPQHHFVFVELLGKGGLWGAGYEWRTRRFAVGGVGSYYMLGGDQFTTLSPYIGIVPAAGDHLSWFVHVGPQVVHRSTPSPGPEWQGMTSTGFAAEVSSGIEYRFTNLSLRGYALAAYGSHFAPGVGLSLGWSL